jgi:hypothetical protein
MSKKNFRPPRIDWTRVIVVVIRALSAIAVVAIATHG